MEQREALMLSPAALERKPGRWRPVRSARRYSKMQAAAQLARRLFRPVLARKDAARAIGLGDIVGVSTGAADGAGGTDVPFCV